MSINIVDIARKRGEKVEAAGAILAKAEKEHREPSAEERQRFNALLNEADQLRMQIANAQSGESLGRIVPQMTNDPLKEVESRLIPKNQSLASRYRNVATSERVNLAKMIARAAGFDVQDSAAEAKMLAGNMDSTGGFAVPVSTAAQIVDLARAKSVCFQAGARVLEMKSSKEILPKLVEDVAPVFKPESVLCLEASGVFGATQLNARTMMVYLPVSNELLADAQGMGEFLQNALADCFATAFDRACLTGTGAGEQPLGIFNNSDVAVTPCIGGSFSYDDLINSHGRIEAANFTPSATVCSVNTQTYFRKLKNGEGDYLKPLDWMSPMLATSSVPDTYGSGAQSLMCVGDFSQLVIGLRMNLRIEILKEARAQHNETVIMGVMRGDCGLLRPRAFDIVGPATV